MYVTTTRRPFEALSSLRRLNAVLDEAFGGGQLTAPAGLLGQMTPGDVFFSLRTVGRDEVAVDDWTFTLAAGRYATAADGINGDAFAFFALE